MLTGKRFIAAYENLLELALNPDNELFQLGPDAKEFIEVFGKMLTGALQEES